jgi:GDP-L-fucose synthase
VVDPIVPQTGGLDPSNGWPLFEPRDFANFAFHREDCRDFFRRYPEENFDYVFHLAAVVGGRLVIEYNPLAVADDLSIDAAYWQWAASARPAKTITFSSSAAYPIRLQQANHYVLLEEHMIDFGSDIGLPDMSYGWAKLTSEYLGKLAYERHGLRSAAYRPFSGYGEDQDDTYPFPSICKRALQGRGSKELTVWGSGKQMRDFIHIDDCVRGVIMTMDRIDHGDALNLSTGVLTSFVEFAKAASDICGYSPVVRGTSEKPEGVYARGGDTKKQRAFGFTPNIDFRTGIERAIRHYTALESS